MAQSEEELISASEKATEGSENRLTEVLATVLDLHHPLSSGLFARCGLDPGVKVRYFTQEWLDDGCQPDMVARSEDADGNPLAELWFENKKDSGFRLGQLEDYHDALARRRGSNSLIALVHDEKAATRSEKWTVLTWQVLAEDADRLARGWGGSDWRTRALGPEAPAMWRLLHELVSYLEKEGLAVIRPLDGRHVDVFRDAAETWERIEGLVDRAGNETGLLPDGQVGWHDDWVAVWQLFRPSKDSWLERRLAPLGLSGWPELSVWAREPLDAPAVAAGYTLPSSLHHVLAAHDDLGGRANAVGLEIREWDDQTRIVRIKRLADFIEGTDSLSVQAARVATFARDAIAAAERLDPGDLEPPPSRSSARTA
jgi:hypothetical protein